MIEQLLTADENQVYGLNRFKSKTPTEISQILSKRGCNFSVDKVQNILNEIDRKTYLNARYEKLSTFTYTYCRVFRVAKEYLKEKHESNIKHVFNIDYSDLYVYFNPTKALDAMLCKGLSSNNLGSIHYMLNSNHSNKYCLLPPAVWELINRTYATTILTGKEAVKDSFSENYNIHTNMGKFYDLIQKWNGKNTKAFNEELMRRYLAVGDWIELLALANEKKLDERLTHNNENLKKLIKGSDKKIRTIDDKDLDINLSKVNIDDKIYKMALEKLRFRRPTNRSINNKVDAANVAITYDLTKDTENKTYYRFISHSKHVSEAFDDIRLNPTEFSDEELKKVERDEVDIACCPQLVSTLSLIENNQIVGIDKDDMQGINAHLEECIRNLEKIHLELYDLRYTRDDCYLEKKMLSLGNKVKLKLEHVLTPLQEYLTNSASFTEKIYPSFIEHMLDINAGVTAGVNYDAVFKEDIDKLKGIFKSQDRHKELMKEVFKSVYEDAEKTLEYYKTNLLEDDVQTVMKKLAEQMDK